MYKDVDAFTCIDHVLDHLADSILYCMLYTGYVRSLVIFRDESVQKIQKWRNENMGCVIEYTNTANKNVILIVYNNLAVIDLLDQYKEMSVTDFTNVLDISHALVSHHLTDMRSKNILQTRREGQQVFYSIKEKSVLGLLKCIQNCKQH